MATDESKTGRKQDMNIRVGGAQLHFQQVQLRDDILIDEIHLDVKNATYEERKSGAAQNGQSDAQDTTQGAVQNAAQNTAKNVVQVEETGFTAIVSEPNLNRLLAANVPADAPARHLRLLLLSGKARITGQFVKSVLSLPFTVEAVPVVDNGTRLHLDFQSAKMGVTLPGPVLDVIEQILNRSLSLDLSRLPFPVRLDEIKCEPGRLTVKGKARIAWPPVSYAPPPAPFSALDKPLPSEIPTQPSPATLPAAPLTAISAPVPEENQNA